MAGVEYQVTKVDPTSTETKGMVYQIHSVSADEAASVPGKVFYAKVIKDLTSNEIQGKVFQVTLINDLENPDIKGKVFNVVLSGNTGVIVVGPDVSPLELPDAVADSLDYVKAYGACAQASTPSPDSPVDIVCNNGAIKIDEDGDLYADGDVETIEDSLQNTAEAEGLLGLSSNRDTHDLISGEVIRRNGIKVLDGTENWSVHSIPSGTWYEADILDNNMFSHLLCTHFVNAPVALNNNAVYKGAGESVLQVRYDDAGSLDNFKQWLADQYDAGTPVIVVYALETPTTDSVTAQTLQVDEGDNTLTITQASLTGLKLEAQYERGEE